MHRLTVLGNCDEGRFAAALTGVTDTFQTTKASKYVSEPARHDCNFMSGQVSIRPQTERTVHKVD